MKTALKMSGADRRTAIIRAARTVFLEKGFDRTTTRELAAAAGVSEALLFKHFPSKEALYRAIQRFCFDAEESKVATRLQALEPSTSSLVFLIHDLAAPLLAARPDDEGRAFIRLVLRSLMDEGAFARVAIQGAPSHWVQKVRQCLEAARESGDLVERPGHIGVGAWCAHQLIAGIMLHFLPSDRVIDYGVPREQLVHEVVWFCLRGMGLREEVIRRHLECKDDSEIPKE